MIVLDTHVWLWWAADRSHLSAAALRALHDAPTLGVSAISAWEVAMLAAKGRIQLAMAARDWIRQAAMLPRLRMLPLTSEAAVLAAELPLHGDPADRMIAASAMLQGVPLLTKDEKRRSFPGVTTIW